MLYTYKMLCRLHVHVYTNTDTIQEIALSKLMTITQIHTTFSSSVSLCLELRFAVSDDLYQCQRKLFPNHSNRSPKFDHDTFRQMANGEASANRLPTGRQLQKAGKLN